MKRFRRGILCGLFAVLFNFSMGCFPKTGDPLILNMVPDNLGEAPYDSRYVDPACLKKMGDNGTVYFLFKSPTMPLSITG